jgi:hypothetical protein
MAAKYPPDGNLNHLLACPRARRPGLSSMAYLQVVAAFL